MIPYLTIKIIMHMKQMMTPNTEHKFEISAADSNTAVNIATIMTEKSDLSKITLKGFFPRSWQWSSPVNIAL